MILVFECWVLSQLFNSPFSPSSRGSLLALHFLPLEWQHLHIWGCWYFSWESWLQLVIHPDWPAFSMMYMMYCVYKLNKQGDDIQPWHTAFTILNQSVVSCPVLIIASWPQVKKVPLVAQVVKNSPTMQDTWVWSLAWEVTLKKGMATHSSILTLRIPQTQEPGGLHKEWDTTEWLTLCFLVNLNRRMLSLGSPVAPSAPHGAAAAHSHSLTHFHHWLLTQSIPLWVCTILLRWTFCFFPVWGYHKQCCWEHY